VFYRFSVENVGQTELDNAQRQEKRGEPAKRFAFFQHIKIIRFSIEFWASTAVAHNEGLGTNWKTRRAFWADRAANESALHTNLLSLETSIKYFALHPAHSIAFVQPLNWRVMSMFPSTVSQAPRDLSHIHAAV
jgi:hypothetical protein